MDIRKFGLVLAFLWGLTGGNALAETANLFVSPKMDLDRHNLSKPGVLRARPVDIDLSKLTDKDPDTGVVRSEGHELILNLFDDVILTARSERIHRRNKQVDWVGKVVGDPHGNAVIVARDGIVAASIAFRDRVYGLRFDGSRHIVEEIDPSLLPEGDDTLQPPISSVPGIASEPVSSSDDGSTIDALVVYTTAAQIAAGGTSSILSRIQLAVQETNTGYANSGVVQRLRLVGTAEVGYSESGDMQTDLNRATQSGDGFMDEVPVLRDTYGADLVSLITATPTPQYCGMAWLMAGNTPSFAPYAYSVVEEVCLSPMGYTFSHELGHNMGSNHARSDPVGDGAYSYSFGYKDPAYAFRTIMAYECPGGCPRILHFSNPQVAYDGKPTGIIETAPNSANNALSLNNTRLTVANWRQARLVPGSNWTIQGVGDVHGDGKSDILWRDDSTGQVAIWAMNGLTITAIDFPMTVGREWQIQSMGDVNGDRRSDVLWRHTGTGQVAIWIMNGTSIGGIGFPMTVGDLNWKIQGTGDFNGDGKSDVLWRHAVSGQVAIWIMNGVSISGIGFPMTVGDLNWKIQAVGDVNADGKADVFWRHGLTGQVGLWIMNATSITGIEYPMTVGDSNWQIAGVGDLNADRRSDVIWRHSLSGQTAVWMMNGPTIASIHNLLLVSDLGWKIAGVGDLTADNRADILWRHVPTGLVAAWLMNGPSVSSIGYPAAPDPLNP